MFQLIDEIIFDNICETAEKTIADYGLQYNLDEAELIYLYIKVKKKIDNFNGAIIDKKLIFGIDYLINQIIIEALNRGIVKPGHKVSGLVDILYEHIHINGKMFSEWKAELCMY